MSLCNCHYAECYYGACCYAECHYAECFYAECRGAESSPSTMKFRLQSSYLFKSQSPATATKRTASTQLKRRREKKFILRVRPEDTEDPENLDDGDSTRTAKKMAQKIR